LILHAVALALLASVNFLVVQPPKQKIKIKTDFVSLRERAKPLTKRNIFRSDSQPKGSSLSAATAQLMKLQNNAKLIGVSPNLAAMGLRLRGLLSKGRSSRFESRRGVGAGDATDKVGVAAPREYGDIMDEFAEDAINAAKRSKLYVIFLFDESISLIDDRKIINQKIDNVAKTVKQDLARTKQKNIRWAVVSFGEKARLWLRPTPDLGEVKKKVAAIKEDVTGKENILAGIAFTIKTFESEIRKGRKVFITAVTDESGTDVKNDELLEQITAILQKTKTRLYVFGRESNFSWPHAWAPYYDPKTGEAVDWNWIDAGPETAESELLAHDWFFNGSARAIPSGFGMYALSRLSEASGGVYYILSDVPTKYDEEKLKRYAPELVSRAEYRARAKASKIRGTLQFIRTEWPKYRPWVWFGRLDRLRDDIATNIAKTSKARDWCGEAAKALEKVRTRDKWQKVRWDANRDFSVAQLYKFKFLLGQYLECMRVCIRKGFPRPKKGKRFNGYHLYFGSAKERIRGGRRARREKQAAEKALKKVVNEHADTPWGVFAQRELTRLVNVHIRPHYYMPRPPGKPRPKM